MKLQQLITNILLSIILSDSLIHNLRIQNDDRAIFKIETFGFIEGGQMNFALTDFSINNFQGNEKLNRIGFVMRKSSSESASEQDLEEIVDKKSCLLDLTTPDDFVIDISNTTHWKSVVATHTIESSDTAGLYSLIFVRCEPSGSYEVNFHLKASFINPGPDYLSAGDAPLPILYFSFFLLFLAALIVWSLVIFRFFGNNGTVYNIHYMMGILLVLKCCTLLFESLRLYYISKLGASEWSVIYLIFASVKGAMLFTVIVLIGSGWSLIKPYLTDSEKWIIFVVLSLQVIDNVAMIVLEETAPGSQFWVAWRDLLHLVDIICCCAILFPIVWSIRHLRQASEVDGKAHTNLQKLKLFRQFYVMVVVYIYFTRIVVLLLSATIPFFLMWLGDLFTELATFIFYIITGYQFRPAISNPYFPVSTEEESGNKEYDLEGYPENI